MKNINRRESPRIDIKLRCHVTSPAIPRRTAMYTENVSRGGVLVVWCGEGVRFPVPERGQILTVEIELPASQSFGQKCIHCQGTVTRIGRSEGGAPCVALRVNYMDFRFLHEGLRALAPEPAANSWTA